MKNKIGRWIQTSVFGADVAISIEESKVITPLVKALFGYWILAKLVFYNLAG
jgi:hypothetical protein